MGCLKVDFMKISIIIPVYNVEAFITECLESVVRQTYRGEMECLIVDDCGTDGSIAVAERFILSYQGSIVFKIIHHDHNRGLSAARNTGVEAATGDCVFFLDSDDAILPETIELMMSVMCEHPQVEMVQGGIMSMKGEPTDDFTKQRLPEYTDNVKWIMENMLSKLPVSSWNRLLKRDFLIRECISFQEGIIHEDVPYNFLLALKCKYVGFVRQNTYLYRPQREGSILNSSTEKRSLQSRLTIMNESIEAHLSHRFETDELKDIALKALWGKWMFYMTLHSYETLLLYVSDVSKISKLMTSITPYPQKFGAILYHSIPLRFRGSRKAIKVFSHLIIN